MHFERGAIVIGWNEKQKAMFLAASPRVESRQLLSGLSDVECRRAKIVERLQLRFGVEKQAEFHQARLLNRQQLRVYKFSFNDRFRIPGPRCPCARTLCCTTFYRRAE